MTTERVTEQVKEDKEEPVPEVVKTSKVSRSDGGSKKSKSPMGGKAAPTTPVQAPDDDMEIAGESEDEVVDQESTKAPVITSPPHRRSSARLRAKSDEAVEEKKESVQKVSKKASPTPAVAIACPSVQPAQTSAQKETVAPPPTQNPAPQPPVSSTQTSRRHSMVRAGPSAAKAKEDVNPQNNNTLDNILAMKHAASSHAPVTAEKEESKQGGAIPSNASKPTNLVGGLHSFTSLMKPQRPPVNAPASGNVHRPEVRTNFSQSRLTLLRCLQFNA